MQATLVVPGDEVRWFTMQGYERGKVLQVVGFHAQVRYGPWLDKVWIKLGELERPEAAGQGGRYTHASSL